MNYNHFLKDFMVETAFEPVIERWLKSWQRKVMARKGHFRQWEKHEQNRNIVWYTLFWEDFIWAGAWINKMG